MQAYLMQILKTKMFISNFQEISEGATVPFIVVRMRDQGCAEKYILKTGDGVSWEVCLRHHN